MYYKTLVGANLNQTGVLFFLRFAKPVNTHTNQKISPLTSSNLSTYHNSLPFSLQLSTAPHPISRSRILNRCNHNHYLFKSHFPDLYFYVFNINIIVDKSHFHCYNMNISSILILNILLLTSKQINKQINK